MVQNTDTAVSLMKMAIALLDRDGEPLAAAHVQRAIEVVNNVPAMQPGEELSSELIDAFLSSRNPH